MFKKNSGTRSCSRNEHKLNNDILDGYSLDEEGLTKYNFFKKTENGAVNKACLSNKYPVGNRNLQSYNSNIKASSKIIDLMDHRNGHGDSIFHKNESEGNYHNQDNNKAIKENCLLQQHGYADHETYRYKYKSLNGLEHTRNGADQNTVGNVNHIKRNKDISKVHRLDSRICHTSTHCNFIYDRREQYKSETNSTNLQYSGTNECGAKITYHSECPYFTKDLNPFRKTSDTTKEFSFFDGMEKLNVNKVLTLAKRKTIGGIQFNNKVELNNCNKGLGRQNIPKENLTSKQYCEKVSGASFKDHIVDKNVQNTCFEYNSQQKILQYRETSLLNNDQRNKYFINTQEIEDFKRIPFNSDTQYFNKTKDVMNFFDDKGMFNEAERVNIKKPILQQISMKQVSIKEYLMRTLYQPVKIKLTKSDIESGKQFNSASNT